MVYQLKVILASTRPGRKGAAVADWFLEIAKQDARFEIELLDLKAVNLPFLDEPNHPRLQQYTQPHTLAWSKTIAAADCFIVILPEYNHSYPATLKNALDFLYNEWQHKPMGFVSYGGISGGMRAQEQLYPVLGAFDMKPILESVNLPFFSKQIDQQGVFKPEEVAVRGAKRLLDATAKWARLLKEIRTGSLT